MPDDWMHLRIGRKPTPAHPLMGLTVLAVEDSRFASDALRLLCLRSGARIRRADCLASARRHLATYRPQVVLVDLGLPDGSGVDLIRELCEGDIRPPAVLAMSGDLDLLEEAQEAGAQAGLAKPIASLGVFQSTILRLLPDEARPSGPRAVDGDEVTPDSIALQDDLAHAAEVLGRDDKTEAVDYVAQFVGSIAQSAKDTRLADAAREYARCRAKGEGLEAARGALSIVLKARLAEAARPI
ncbi:MAG: response regulator [Pseudomonadota bacterium]